MLTRTFIHLPGIGALTERRLWDSGVKTWADLRRRLQPESRHSSIGGVPFSAERAALILAELDRSERALLEFDSGYFGERLPGNERWRLLEEFEGSSVFLDIETTGLSRIYNEVTVVGAYSTSGHTVGIRGYNVENALRRLEAASIVVTFNGALFDVPFLLHKFPDIKLPPVHVDLRYPLRKLGLTGGLKRIEKELGWRRYAAKDVTGRDAVRLWYEYVHGNAQALSPLLRYNLEDSAVLLRLSRLAYRRLASEHVPLNEFKRRASRAPRGVGIRNELAEIDGVWQAASARGYQIRRPTVDTLFGSGKERSDSRIVGIDLSGSEKRNSGWALLEGRNVTTRLLRTDTELIQATVDSEPDLVSIDSPLSLPPGTVVENDRILSFQRIHRDSELELRRRGVSVYWCLIDSMRGLTLRGMKLARQLRTRRLKVIESFPGAAQDIIGFPRKRRGVRGLSQALAEFGLEGDFVTDVVSHDELDAITSALVGLFYLAGQYEALGESEESDLIVPVRGR